MGALERLYASILPQQQTQCFIPTLSTLPRIVPSISLTLHEPHQRPAVWDVSSAHSSMQLPLLDRSIWCPWRHASQTCDARWSLDWAGTSEPVGLALSRRAPCFAWKACIRLVCSHHGPCMAAPFRFFRWCSELCRSLQTRIGAMSFFPAIHLLSVVQVAFFSSFCRVCL